MGLFGRGPRAREVPRAEVLDAIRSSDLFIGFSDTELGELASSVEEVDYEPGQAVIKKGRLPRFVYIVRSGTLDVIAGEAGRVRTLGPRTHFGEVGVFEGMPSTASVVAAERCSLLRIPSARFLDLLRDRDEVPEAIARSVAEALARTHPAYRPVTAPAREEEAR